MAAAGCIDISTVTTMEGARDVPGQTTETFTTALASVVAVHRAGVPVLAGTDSNAFPGVPVQVPHGASLHHELELLVDADLAPPLQWAQPPSCRPGTSD